MTRLPNYGEIVLTYRYLINAYSAASPTCVAGITWLVRSASLWLGWTLSRGARLCIQAIRYYMHLLYGVGVSRRITPQKLFLPTSYHDPYVLFVCMQLVSRLFSLPAAITILKTLQPMYTPFDVFFIKLFLLHLNPMSSAGLTIDLGLLFFNIFVAVRFLNIDPLISLICKSIKGLVIFKHKALFSTFFSFFRNTFETYFHKFSLVGVFVSVKGKVGLTGDARKRRMFLNLGSTSRFNMRYRVVYKSTTLVTKSGSLGLQMWWFFS